MKIGQLLFLCSVILGMTGAPSYCQVKEPYVRVAEIKIDPGQSVAYLDALKEQIHAALRIEAGVVALYSVADKENPAHITLFEIYTDAGAYKTHVETEHFKKYQTVTIHPSFERQYRFFLASNENADPEAVRKAPGLS